MIWILKKLIERLKTLLMMDAALDLESEFLARHANRKAELLQQADDYEQRGLHDVAEELRGQAQQLSLQSPLASASDEPTNQLSEAFSRPKSHTPSRRIGTTNGKASRKTSSKSKAAKRSQR